MKLVSHFVVALALTGGLVCSGHSAWAGTPVRTAEFRAGDRVAATPVRGYRPYRGYHRPYYGPGYGYRVGVPYRTFYGNPAYGYRPYVYGYTPYVYRPYVYGPRAYPAYRGYYGRPGFYFGYRW